MNPRVMTSGVSNDTVLVWSAFYMGTTFNCPFKRFRQILASKSSECRQARQMVKPRNSLRGRRAALKQKVPFGTSDVVTLQFIAGYKPSTNKECRQARLISSDSQHISVIPLWIPPPKTTYRSCPWHFLLVLVTRDPGINPWVTTSGVSNDTLILGSASDMGIT